MSHLLYFTFVAVSVIGITIFMILLMTASSRIKIRSLSSKHYPSSRQSQKRISDLLSLTTFIFLCFLLLSQLAYISQEVLHLPINFHSTKSIILNSPQIRHSLSSLQLIFWHCGCCILFTLLSYRLQALCSDIYSFKIFTVLALLILAQITIFLALSILRFNEIHFIDDARFTHGILPYILMSGYCLESILSITLWILYILPLCKLSVYRSERVLFNQFSGSITSECGKTPPRPRDGHLFTIASIPTMDETLRTGTDHSVNLNDHSINFNDPDRDGADEPTESTDIDDLIPSEVTSSYKTGVTAPYQAPPLKLKSDADQTLLEHHRNQHRDTELEQRIRSHDVHRMTAMMTKYALLTTMAVVCKLVVNGLLVVHYLMKERNVLLELWYFGVNMDCVIGGIAMYLGMNLRNSDREYRKCCLLCDWCCGRMCSLVTHCWVRHRYTMDDIGSAKKRSSAPFNEDYRPL